MKLIFAAVILFLAFVFPEYAVAKRQVAQVNHKLLDLRFNPVMDLSYMIRRYAGSQVELPKKLRDLAGRPVRLSDYRGKVVLINFWATWCPPCRAEMPDLIKLQREHGKDGLQIIGITYPPERKARVRRFASKLKVNYPIALGTHETRALFSSDETLPLTVGIDRDGKVSEIISGILLRQEFDEKIKPLLTKNTEGEIRNADSNH
jgi:thiol-disulfide isomerase/thioredoxin